MNRQFLPVSIVVCSLLLVVTACSPQAAGPTAVPTITATPYVFPTYAYNPPTEAPQVATIAAATAAVSQPVSDLPALDPTAVERGKGRWDVLECGSCHGENGEGTDKGSALAGTTISEDAFVDFLRTGGTIGNDHLYATDRLSQGGIGNLYQYVLSLKAD